jgi:TonB family protein
MSGALEAPRKAGERRTHATRRLNGSVPTQARHDTWFENDPAAPRERLLVMQSSTFEVPDGSHAPAEAADPVRPTASASAGVASPAESPGGHTTIHLLARTTFDRATLLPLKTQVDTDGGVGPLSRIASLTYEFQWEKDTFDKVQVGAREKGAEPVEHEPEPADAGGNRAPSVRLLQPPRYPLMAMLLGAQGEALVKVLVSPDGRALQVELDTTSRWGLLDLAAMDAVEHARFHPELVGGQAVESWTLVPIDFSLTDAHLQRYRLPQSVPTPTPSAESENDP